MAAADTQREGRRNMADDNDLMTRGEVARKFGVTSETVSKWARRKRPVLTGVRTTGDRPGYRRTEIEELYRSGFRGGPYRV
jgi:hypothetical protein